VSSSQSTTIGTCSIAANESVDTYSPDAVTDGNPARVRTGITGSSAISPIRRAAMTVEATVPICTSRITGSGWSESCGLTAGFCCMESVVARMNASVITMGRRCCPKGGEQSSITRGSRLWREAVWWGKTPQRVVGHYSSAGGAARYSLWAWNSSCPMQRHASTPRATQDSNSADSGNRARRCRRVCSGVGARCQANDDRIRPRR
jgi:hypothetical protein